MIIIDSLIQKIVALKAPVVIGLDPVLSEIPDAYKKPYLAMKNKFAASAKVLYDFNKDMINAFYDIAPAVKPQIAMYEKYGSYGIKAYEKTIQYAKKKGMFVVADAKRNDIGNTAKAYAGAFLGTVDLLDGSHAESFSADWLTVSPFLGSDSITPFVDVCIGNNRGIFILVKTSNPAGGDIQNKISTQTGNTIFSDLARFVNIQSERFVGKFGYSPIGAVVGATYPAEAEELRMLMPKAIFLVPGYGAQGGKADDVVPCFNKGGLGAIVNSSRGIMCAYKTKHSTTTCTKEQFKAATRNAVLDMIKEINTSLNENEKGFN